MKHAIPTLAAITILAAMNPAAAGLGNARKATVVELDGQRGRFLLPNGAMVDFAINITSHIDGQKVRDFTLAGDAQGLTIGSGGTQVRLPPPGIGNPAGDAALREARGLLTTLQNSLDNVTIRNAAQVTVNYSGLGSVRGGPLGGLSGLGSVFGK